ncbi:DUF2939 domain-containing protein [Brevundimonas sp. 2R-24]|uniref:DUF2939 domain-containing protein n=1 Tax=Peiella sedimenti TaxID=3061083 RepID=A0ABT8SLD1_9CAUL|nr:DUF2939 domain-containing protein [Caulobacteraceae bacterium XZ-24]
MRALSNLLVAAIILAALAFVAAPFAAFFGVRSAGQARDIQALADLVDFDAVRASLRPQLSGQAADQTPPPSILADPVGAIRRQLEQARPGPDVDAYLTPEALAGLTDGEGRFASQRTAEDAVPGTSFREPWPQPKYWGVNRMRFAVADEGGSETIFTFERRGIYAWKLAHIGLPEGAGPEAQVPASR